MFFHDKGNKRFTVILLFLLLTGFTGGALAEDNTGVNFKNIKGNWDLLYGNNYGYTFRFYKNYKAVIILYLNNSSLVFKGIYNIEDRNSVRINISEMKREERVKNLNLRSGFVKAKSSYFIFNAQVSSAPGSRYLELRPQTISIDGNSSEGYFEPYIKLKYSGK